MKKSSAVGAHAAGKAKPAGMYCELTAFYRSPRHNAVYYDVVLFLRYCSPEAGLGQCKNV